MKVEREIDIAAPRERVYEVVMDPRRLHEWVTIHAGLQQAPSGELREGSELSQALKLAGRRFTVHWRVVEDDCPNRVVWEGHGPVHSRARVVYEFHQNGAGGTRFVYSNEYTLPGGVLGRLGGRAIAPASRHESERSLNRLKQLVERG
jgi:carbon monoxide dehydrogenase subunit G